MRRATIYVVAVLLVAATVTGCTAFVETIDGPNTKFAGRTLSIIQANNETIELGAGTFRGPLRIEGNSVTITGAGIGMTVITGGAVIRGNSNRLENLSVEGPVRVVGNNNDLRGAELRSGDTEVDGNNNEL